MTYDIVRYFSGRRGIYWLVFAAAIYLLGYITPLLDNSVRIQAFNNVRVIPASELAGLIICISGCIFVWPRLPTWEASASRKIEPYLLFEALTIIVLSSLINLTWPFGHAWNSARLVSIDPHEIWRAEALGAMKPFAMGTAAISAIVIGVYALFGQKIGTVLSGAFVVSLWYMQISPIGRWVPLPGVMDQSAGGILASPGLMPQLLFTIVFLLTGIGLWLKRFRTRGHLS